MLEQGQGLGESERNWIFSGGSGKPRKCLKLGVPWSDFCFRKRVLCGGWICLGMPGEMLRRPCGMGLTTGGGGGGG